MIRPATTRLILGFDSSNSLQEVSFVKSTAVTDTDVSIERVHVALYDSYVVTGPRSRVASEAASPLVVGGPGAQQGPLDGASFGVLMVGEQQGRTEIPWPPITGVGIAWSCRKSSE